MHGSSQTSTSRAWGCRRRPTTTVTERAVKVRAAMERKAPLHPVLRRQLAASAALVRMRLAPQLTSGRLLRGSAPLPNDRAALQRSVLPSSQRRQLLPSLLQRPSRLRSRLLRRRSEPHGSWGSGSLVPGMRWLRIWLEVERICACVRSHETSKVR